MLVDNVTKHGKLRSLSLYCSLPLFNQALCWGGSVGGHVIHRDQASTPANEVCASHQCCSHARVTSSSMS